MVRYMQPRPGLMSVLNAAGASRPTRLIATSDLINMHISIVKDRRQYCLGVQDNIH